MSSNADRPLPATHVRNGLPNVRNDRRIDADPAAAAFMEPMEARLLLDAGAPLDAPPATDAGLPAALALDAAVGAPQPGPGAIVVTRRTTFDDHNGSPVTIIVTGAVAHVYTDGDGSGRIERIEVYPTKTRATISIATKTNTTVDDIILYGTMTKLAAPKVTLRGDLTAAGGLSRLVLDDVEAGAVIGINTDGDIDPNPRQKLAAIFGDVANATLTVTDMPVKSILAQSWTGGQISAERFGSVTIRQALDAIVTAAGVDARGVSFGRLQVGDADGAVIDAAGGIKTLKAAAWDAGTVEAGWIGKLILGTAKLPGEFSTEVTVTGENTGARTRVLNSARVYGTIADIDWSITGAAGGLRIGEADTWSLTDFTALQSLRITDAQDVTIDGDATIGLLKAGHWTGGTIDADWVKNLVVSNTMANAAATIDLAGIVTLGAGANITWTGDSIKTMRVKGNLTDAAFTLIEPVAAKRKTLGSLTVKGLVEDSTLRSAGHVGAVTVGGLIDSTLLAGIRDNYNLDADGDGVLDLPTAAGDYVTGGEGEFVRLAKVVIKGRPGLGGDLLVNSNVAAGVIGPVTVRRVQIDNGPFFGFAAGDSIKSVIWIDGPARRKWRTVKWPADTEAFVILAPGLNVAPRAGADSAATDEDTPVVIGDLLDNDSDVNGDSFNLIALTQPEHGSVVAGVGGTVTYTPDDNYNGPDSFTYTVSDGDDSDTATVIVTVNAVNDAPIAGDDAIVTDEDRPLTLTGLLDNDSDVDGDTLTILPLAQPANGTVVDNDDGTLTYTPDENYYGPDSFTYVVSDGAGGTDTAAVTVSVEPVNDAPNAVDDAAAGDEDADITTGDVLANDSDVETVDLAIESFTQPTHGTVVDNDDGTFTYTPDDNYSGPDSFTYTIVDADGETDMATVALTVNPVNDAPEAADDDAVVVVNESIVTGDVLANDSDLDGDDLVIDSFTQPSHGSVAAHGDGTFIYTPDEDFLGDDTFTYTVSDGDGGTDVGTVTVSVVSVINDAPEAVDAAYTTYRNAPFITADLLAAASDADGDDITVDSFTHGANGTVAYNGDGTFTYTVTDHFVGDDSFTYTVSDGRGGTDTATVTLTKPAITLDELGAPSLGGVEAQGWRVYRLRCTAADLADAFHAFSLEEISGVHQVHGSILDHSTGADLIGMDADWADFDTNFTFTFGRQEFSLGLTETNDASNPTGLDFTSGDWVGTAGIGTYEMLAGSLARALITDLSYPFFQFVLPASADLTLTGQAVSGEDNAFGFSITVDGDDNANAAPGANNDTAVTQINQPVTTGDVLANDVDIDGDDITLDSFTQPAHGSVVYHGDGTFTYTPDADYMGDDAFTYTISDDHGHSDTATVAVTVGEENETPVAVDADYTVVSNAPFTTANLLALATDADGDTLTVEAFTQPQHGTVVYDDGTFTYTLTEYFAGDDSFTYTVGDGRGGTDTATVTITKPAITVDELGAPSLDGVDADGWRTYRLRATGNDIDGVFHMFTIHQINGVHNVRGSIIDSTSADLIAMDADWEDFDTYFMFTFAQQQMSFGISETNDASNPTGLDFTAGALIGTAGVGTFEAMAGSLDVDQIEDLSFPFFQFVLPVGAQLTLTGLAIQGGNPSISFSVSI